MTLARDERRGIKQALAGLGPLEGRIMELLWAQGEMTVGEVAEELANDKKPAYTTVMTVMSRLFEKGLLLREFEGRAYVYKPASTKEGFLAGVSQSMIRSLVDEFGEVALAQFVEAIEKADPERIQRLSEILKSRGRR